MPPLTESRFSDRGPAASSGSLERRAHAGRRRGFDPFRPHALFTEQERAHSGSIVDVLTVLLRNRECPWRCIYCDLWKETTLTTVPLGAVPAQIDYALTDPNGAAARQIKLYNAGSFFDPNAIPVADHEIIANRLKRFERVIVECHPAFTRLAPTFRRTLGAAQLEVAMGLEAADDALLERLQKRAALSDFRASATLLLENDIAVRMFIMLKPPFVRSDEQALVLAKRSIDFAFECGAQALTLIPSRFGPEQLNLLAAAGEFAPPALATIEHAFDYGLNLGAGRVFVDLWNTEELGRCPRCGPQRRERLRCMNLSQARLPAVPCSCST